MKRKIRLAPMMREEVDLDLIVLVLLAQIAKERQAYTNKGEPEPGENGEVSS